MGSFRLTIEIPLLLVNFSFMMIGGVMMNFMMYKACYNLLGYPEVNCSRLGRDTDNATQELEKAVQPTATILATVVEMLPSSLPAVLSLMIGSWSDKYGRRPVAIYVICAITLSLLITTLISLFTDLNPYAMMISSIPTILCGGFLTLYSVSLACLNDEASTETRGLRMATFDVIHVFSTVFGTYVSSKLLYATSYFAVFGTATILVALAGLYVTLFLPETLKNKSEEKPTVSDFFKLDNIKDIFKVATKKRPYNKKTIILILLLILVVINGITVGEMNIKNLYLRQVLAWTLSQRNYFTSWSNMVIIIGTITFVYILQKKLKISESILSLFGISGHIGVSILFGLATNNWYIYATVPVSVLGGLVMPMLRTKLGQSVPPSEMGKIFSFINVMNSFINLGAGLLYSFIYNSTIYSHPEMFNWFSMVLYICCMLNIGVVMYIESGQPAEAKDLSSIDHEYEEKAQVKSKNSST